MAEFLVRDLYGDRIYAQSAGIHKGDEDGFMQAVMAERKIDVTTHQPEAINELEDHFVDVVITLTQQAHDATLDFFKDEAVEVEFWETVNPSLAMGRREEVLAAYRETREQLEARIKERFG